MFMHLKTEQILSDLFQDTSSAFDTINIFHSRPFKKTTTAARQSIKLGNFDHQPCVPIASWLAKSPIFS